MNAGRVSRKLFKGTEGSATVIAALTIVAVFGIVTLAMDLGHLYTARNELQNSADAAALAAAGNLIHDYGAGAVVDGAAAQQSALTVAQLQSTASGLPVVGNEARNDLTIIFGNWNVNAGNPSTAWTAIGPIVGSSSNANAVQVTITRAAGTVYGPVTNFVAGVLGFKTSQVSATAIAYLGYTTSTPTGTVTVPFALPDTVLHAAKPGGASWWASLLSPTEAIASVTNTVTFQDLGSNTFYQSNLTQPQFNSQNAYMVLVNASDAVPDTIIQNLQKNYTSGTPVRPIALGSQLYPLSEYQWSSNVRSIFQAFQSAFNAKKDTHSGKWRVTVPLYSTTKPVAQRLLKGLEYLARLLSPVSQAHACFEFWNQSYPGGNVPIYVNGFANVDITAVTYNSNCDDCSSYSPAKNGKKYASSLDCAVNNPQSYRNANSVTVQVTPGSNATPPAGSGSLSGGPSNQTIYSSAPTGTSGAVANIPRLVK